MAVAETRLRVVLVDDATAQLLRMNKAMSSLSSSLLGANTSGVTKELNNLNNTVNNINKSVSSLTGTLTKVTGVYKTLSTLGNIFGNVFGGTFEYYKDFQSNAVGIAGILSSMTTINGKTLEWNDSLAMSKNIMAKLRVEALQTSTTSKDLIETFRGILGPGLSQGMKIDEILQFSKVGVNAVRSLGLPSNQYLQELRSILQGNIRASSSTLATALGITNQDVKNAKNNAGGVFKFLMDRMKGFAQSTTETSKTLTGQLAILEEAYKTIGMQAYENLFNSFSKSIESVNKLLLIKNKDGLYEINDEIVSSIANVANVLDTALNKAINNIKWIVDNIGIVATGLGAFVVLPKALEKAQTLFLNIKEISASIKTGILGYDIQKEQQLTQLKRDQSKIHTDILNKLERGISAKNNEAKLVEKVNNAKNGEAFIVEKITRLEEILVKTELSREEVCRRILNFERQISSVKDKQQREKLANDFIVELSRVHQENNEAMLRGKEITESYSAKMEYFASGVSNVCNKLGEMTHGLTAGAFAVKLFTDEEDGAINKMADFVIGADLVITAIGGISKALSVACGWLKTFTKWQAVAMAFKGFGAVGGAGIGLLVGGATTGVAAMLDDDIHSMTDVYNRYFLNPNDIDYKQKKAIEEYNKAKAENSNFYFDLDTGLGQGERPLGDRYNELINAFPGGGDSGKKSKGKTPEEITASYNKLIESIKSSKENAQSFGNAYNKAMAGANKQVATWQESLSKIEKTGILSEEQIGKAKTLMNQYLDEMINKAKEAERSENLGLLKSKISQADNVMLFGGSQEEQYKRKNQALQEYKNYLDTILADTELNIQQRINYEQQYADAVKQIRQNDMTNFSTAWKATLDELSQQQINYGESVRNVFSSIETSATSLLTSTESFGKRIKNFFSDIASSIMQEMSKLIMKALITNVLLSAFSRMFGGKKIGTSVDSINSGTTNLYQNSANYSLGKNVGISTFASGGLANGWAIVGEHGAELVNFSNPGRVYTAEQTRNALSGGGQNVNIKIDLRNESGQELQAEQTGSQFDGENWVVGIVLKAMATNKGGIRTAMKGLANA